MIIVNENFFSEVSDLSKDLLNSFIHNSVYKFDYRLEKNKVLFLEESFFEMMSHLRRLRLKIPMYFSIEYFNSMFQKLIKEKSHGSYIINLNFALDSLPSFDNNESELLTLFSIKDVESILIIKKGIKISLFKDFKINRNELSSFLNNSKLVRLAKLDAFENSYDDNVILNDENQVTRSAYGNIILFKNKTIITPLISDGTPHSYLVKPFINYLEKNKFKCIEKSFSIFDLQTADGIGIMSINQGFVNVGMYKKKQFNKSIFVEIFSSFIKDEIL
ncbi:MAG: hypothetical protein CMD29_02045 [Flavobacteriales bacterium]|nr:hypothetical protein [Flavobacteriales bacterium]